MADPVQAVLSHTQSSMESARAVWKTSWVLSTAVVLVAVSDLRRRRTSHCHGYVPSLRSTPSPTLASLRGTLFYSRAVSHLRLFRKQLKTLFSVWRLMSIDCVMHLCPLSCIYACCYNARELTGQKSGITDTDRTHNASGGEWGH